MNNENISTNQASWTWADQISTYRFWGIYLFYIFLLAPNIIINLLPHIISKGLYEISLTEFNKANAFKFFAGFGGFWLAWLMTRSKKHYLLYLFSSFIIIGLLLLLLAPSPTLLSISFSLIGLGSGAITLAVPTIISGGKGGSEMFIISFGLISFLALISNNSLDILLLDFFYTFDIDNFTIFIVIGLTYSILGIILLLPVKTELFNVPPKKREKTLTPTYRNPTTVALLCLIPLYNIYYFLQLSYRLHGEVNQINPTQNILSPKAGVWSTLLLPIILLPVIASSLNTNLTIKLKENNVPKFYKTWAIILWAFIFTPISYALIQSNLNQLIKKQ